MSQSTSLDPSYDAARSVVRIEAGALARRHNLYLKRVHRVMLRTAVDDYGRPLPLPKPGHDTLEYGLRFAPSLNEALAFLPPEDALRVLERNSDALLATGYPATSFAASRWLD